MADQDEVLAASDRFYRALETLTNGDPGPMAEIWSHAHDVTTMHAFGGKQRGWDDVWQTWQRMAGAASEGGSLRVTDQQLRVFGDMAYTTGTEHVEVTLDGRPVRFDVRVTNVFRREAGQWKVVHHHADAAPAARAALLRLDPNL